MMSLSEAGAARSQESLPLLVRPLRKGRAGDGSVFLLGLWECVSEIRKKRTLTDFFSRVGEVILWSFGITDGGLNIVLLDPGVPQ